MNFESFGFDADTKEQLSALERSIPHAIIIEGENDGKTEELADFLSAYILCSDTEKPCRQCAHCQKAFKKIHPDIQYVKPDTNKSKTYTIEQIKNLISDASILPNDAEAKVYILEAVDEKLTVIAQNAFLKLLEEPPKNVFFLLRCKNAQKLLITIRSRCALIRTRSKLSFSDKTVEHAEKIAEGILSTREYELLKAMKILTDKSLAEEVLSALTLILRDSMVILSGGEPRFNAGLGKKLALRFPRKTIIALIEATGNARPKIKQNANLALLSTYLCGEYRRISWQRS